MPKDPFSRTLARIVDAMVIAAGWWLIALSVAVLRRDGRPQAVRVQPAGHRRGRRLHACHRRRVRVLLHADHRAATRGSTSCCRSCRSACSACAERAGDGEPGRDGAVRVWRAATSCWPNRIEFQSRADDAAADADVDPAVALVPRPGPCSRSCAPGPRGALRLRCCSCATGRGQCQLYGPQTLEEEIESEAGEVLAAARAAALTEARS